MATSERPLLTLAWRKRIITALREVWDCDERAHWTAEEIRELISEMIDAQGIISDRSAVRRFWLASWPERQSLIEEAFPV